MQGMGLMVVCCGMALKKGGKVRSWCEEDKSTECEDTESDTGW